MAIAVAEVMRGVASKKTAEGVRMGNELEKVRIERGLTQQDVADRLVMSLQGYLGYRKGYSKVTQKSLIRWATALGMPPARLAKRLGIELVVCESPDDLRGQLAALFGPDRGDEYARLLQDTADLSPEAHADVLNVARSYFTGRYRTERPDQS